MADSFTMMMTVFQVAMFVSYGLLTTYEKSPASTASFGIFQNIQVMIFVGFGFLMTVMKKYGWGATGFTMLFALVASQLGLILTGIAHNFYDGKPVSTKIPIDVNTIMNSEFCAGAVLISFGGVIGKISPTQMLAVTLMESIFYAVNEVIVASGLQVIDAGGSTAIHAFGAYFGLALSKALGNASGVGPDSSHTNGMFAMVGTLFLWMYWPSFNAGPTAPGSEEQQIAIVNTWLAIASSTLASFLCSKKLRGGKFDMEDIQNATLAGGVAMGASATMNCTPVGAMAIGYLAGVISTSGYVFGSGKLEAMGIHDTCGINNLHGMPAVLGGLSSAVVLTMNGESAEQAKMQVAATVVSVTMGMVGGLITGVIVNASFFEPLKATAMYDDAESWVLEYS